MTVLARRAERSGWAAGAGRSEPSRKPAAGGRFFLRLQWLVGASLLAAVVVAVLHVSEGKEVLALFRRVHPGWMAAACLLQVLTYPLQALIWTSVSKTAGFALPFLSACRFSLGKIFVDQALPSAGISGTVLLAGALQRRGLPRRVVMALVVVNTVSYYAAYVLGVAAALAVISSHRRAGVAVILASALFSFFGMAFSWGVLALSGAKKGWFARKLASFKPMSRLVGLLGDADPHLARHLPLHAWAALLQTGILLLDGATMWALIRSLGAGMSVMDAFAGTMVATLFRTVGISPGGLGTFEAASVLALKTAGLSVPAALSATLLFRVLSYWIPMLPGYWFSRRIALEGTG